MLKLARHAMRTRFELVIADDGPEADLRAAGEEAFDEIERIEAQLSAFREDSELFLLNAKAADTPVKVDPRFFALLERTTELCEQTDGAFDFAIGALLKCWFRPGTAGVPPASTETAIPSDLEIASALDLIDIRRNVILDRENLTVSFRTPGVRLDPGAIGKGYAIERATNLLREAGIQRALLHGGTSSISAIGSPPDSDGWPVAIQHPLNPNATIGNFKLTNQSLSVSAVHGKTFYASSPPSLSGKGAGGLGWGHIIDPRTGRPVSDTLLSAVVCDSAMEGDALSTALLVLGRNGIEKLSTQYPSAGFLVVSSIDSKLSFSSAGEVFEGLIIPDENTP